MYENPKIYLNHIYIFYFNFEKKNNFKCISNLFYLLEFNKYILL